MIRRKVREVGSPSVEVGMLFHRVPGILPEGWLYHYFITKGEEKLFGAERNREEESYKGQEKGACPDLLAPTEIWTGNEVSSSLKIRGEGSKTLESASPFTSLCSMAFLSPWGFWGLPERRASRKTVSLMLEQEELNWGEGTKQE